MRLNSSTKNLGAKTFIMLSCCQSLKGVRGRGLSESVKRKLLIKIQGFPQVLRTWGGSSKWGGLKTAFLKSR